MSEETTDLTELTTPVAADAFLIVDTSTNATRKITWQKIESTIRTIHDALYALVTGEDAVNTVAAAGATETLTLAPVHRVTMDENCTFTFPSPTQAAMTFQLNLSGAFDPTFPGSVVWSSGVEPTYASPSLYIFTTTDSGTTWFGHSTGSTFSGGTPDPPQPPGGMLIGATVQPRNGDSVAEATATFNTQIGAEIQIARRFDGGTPTSWATGGNSNQFNVDTGQRHRIVSIKGVADHQPTQAQWETFIGDIPNDGFRTYIISHHEPDNDGGSHTPAWFQGQLNRLHAAWVAQGSPAYVIPSFCLTGWLDRDGNNSTTSADWFPHAGIIDDFTFFWDPYDPNGNRSLEQQADPTLQVWRAAGGGDWGIAETGTKQTGSAGVTWISDGMDWCRSEGAVAVCWFHSSVGTHGPWYLDDTLMRAEFGSQIGA